MRHTDAGPHRLVVWNPLLHCIHHSLERRPNVSVVSPDHVHIFPPAKADGFEDLVDVLKRKLHLSRGVVGLKRAGLRVPAALASAFDQAVAQVDGLRVVAHVAVCGRGARRVVVLE
jgi:hypothetical protein